MSELRGMRDEILRIWNEIEECLGLKGGGFRFEV